MIRGVGIEMGRKRCNNDREKGDTLKKHCAAGWWVTLSFGGRKLAGKGCPEENLGHCRKKGKRRKTRWEEGRLSDGNVDT